VKHAKKLLALVLTLTLAFGLAVPATAGFNTNQIIQQQQQQRRQQQRQGNTLAFSFNFIRAFNEERARVGNCEVEGCEDENCDHPRVTWWTIIRETLRTLFWIGLIMFGLLLLLVLIMFVVVRIVT